MNKMDKLGANFHKSLESVEQKLNVQPLVVQLPIGAEKGYTGLVDLVTMTKHTWPSDSQSDGRTFSSMKLDGTSDSTLYEESLQARTTLIENLANVDEKNGGHVPQ